VWDSGLHQGHDIRLVPGEIVRAERMLGFLQAQCDAIVDGPEWRRSKARLRVTRLFAVIETMRE